MKMKCLALGLTALLSTGAYASLLAALGGATPITIAISNISDSSVTTPAFFYGELTSSTHTLKCNPALPATLQPKGQKGSTATCNTTIDTATWAGGTLPYGIKVTSSMMSRTSPCYGSINKSNSISLALHKKNLTVLTCARVS
jgi:hypothetical protein